MARVSFVFTNASARIPTSSLTLADTYQKFVFCSIANLSYRPWIGMRAYGGIVDEVERIEGRDWEDCLSLSAQECQVPISVPDRRKTHR